jgi:hypothetical protein
MWLCHCFPSVVHTLSVGPLLSGNELLNYLLVCWVSGTHTGGVSQDLVALEVVFFGQPAR